MKNSPANNSDSSRRFVSVFRLIGFILSRTVWRVEHHGLENIPARENGAGLIVAANHQTYLDPVWISLPIKRDLRFMAWNEAFGWFLVGNLIRRLGAFPVRLERGKNVEAFRKALEILRNGAGLVIFPEGERAFADGRLLEFKPGAMRLALEAKVSVLPVTIRGGSKIWARGAKLPKPGKIEIFYHPVMNFSETEKNGPRSEARVLTKKLKDTIASKL